jgi:hypothetical protein
MNTQGWLLEAILHAQCKVSLPDFKAALEFGSEAWVLKKR